MKAWQETYEVEQTGFEILNPGRKSTLEIPPPCEHLGPYTIVSITKAGTRVKLVRCNRPIHDDGNHQHAGQRGPTHVWGANGEKVYPA